MRAEGGGHEPDRTVQARRTTGGGGLDVRGCCGETCAVQELRGTGRPEDRAPGGVPGRAWDAGAVDTSPLHELAGFPFACAVGITDAQGELLTEGEDRVRPFMSVSKPITALGALVAVARGLLDLDDPAGPEGATVRHLLAHTAGYGFDIPREDPLAAPGARRIYSNTGFEVLGEVVEESTGHELAEWLEMTVVQPLGITALDVEGSPAAGFHGTVADLLAVGRELLAPTLVPAELHEEATSVQFPGLPGILPGYGRQKDNAWGLGLEIRAAKDPHWTAPEASASTFGHFGQSGSFLWVDPERGLAAAFLGDEPFGPEHVARWPRLSSELLARAAAR